MSDPTQKALYRALAGALAPLTARVRTDITAVKRADGSRWTNDPLTPALLEHHVNGGPARGVCPIREGQSVTMVALLDLDSHRGESTWAEMTACGMEIIDLLRAQGYQPIAFRSSGGRGIHIMLLWDTPQDAYSVRTMLSDSLALLGLSPGDKGVAKGQVEIFPKQDEVGLGEYGNQFILPLAGASEPLDTAFGLEPMGKEWALHMTWPASPAVPRRERPVRDTSALEATSDPIEKVRAALFTIRNDGSGDSPDYSRWRDLAFAVHEATGGSDLGAKLFAEWSAQNPIFDAKFFEQRVWAYIKPADARHSGGITRSALYGWAGEAGWTGWQGGLRDASGFEDVTDEDRAAVRALGREVAVAKAEAQAEQDEERSEARAASRERWRAAMAQAQSETELVDRVCPQIQRDEVLIGVDRSMLAELLKGRLSVLGAKLGIADCRKLIAPAKQRESDGPKPDWVDGWVYVTDEDKFYRIDSDESLTMQSFNARFNRELPPVPDNAFQPTASWAALNELRIPTVTRRLYLPTMGPLFELNGVSCVNWFRPSTMPKRAPKMTRAGLAARDLVLRHLNIITGGRESVVDVLVNWMAHNVQFPGKKIRWAPLIKGTQGDGKTLIAVVMEAVLGMENVKNIGPKVLGTDFSDWAHGSCVAALEEIRLTGHSRYEILDALKPFVTNTRIAVHPKGGKEFNTINTQNYIAFTNHSDALPLDDGDRRWFIVFTPFLRLSDLQAVVGDTGAYFDALYEAIHGHREELRLWLEDHPIAASFKPDGTAPMTEEKGAMIAMSTSDEDEVVRDVLEAGGPGIGKRALVTSAVSDALIGRLQDGGLKTSALARVLAKMGWIKVPQQLKWRGQNCRCWVRGLKLDDNEGIRAELDLSLDTSGRKSDATTGFEDE